MGCLVVLIALMVPRAAMVLIWLFTNWFNRSFDSLLWPVLGFLFMPYTTLAYMGGMLHGGIHGLWLVLLIVAVIVDIGHWGGGERVHRHRRR